LELGRLTGQKRPLRPKDGWAIRVRHQLEHRKRDFALFNLGTDRKLKGADCPGARWSLSASVTRCSQQAASLGEQLHSHETHESALARPDLLAGAQRLRAASKVGLEHPVTDDP